jgi:hypothetical protein
MLDVALARRGSYGVSGPVRMELAREAGVAARVEQTLSVSGGGGTSGCVPLP